MYLYHGFYQAPKLIDHFRILSDYRTTPGPTTFVGKSRLCVVSRVNLYQDNTWLAIALRPKMPRWVKGNSKGP